MAGQVFFVGTSVEVAHHAAPLAAKMPIQIAEPADVVVRARSGDLAVFYSEHFDRFRSAVQQLKQAQVVTLYLLDGILEWRNAWENRSDEPACPYTMRPVLAHKAACIGPSQFRILNSWGNGLKTEIVGVPRFDGIADAVKTAETRPSLRAADVFRILVMTSKTPGFTDHQMHQVETALLDLKSRFEQMDFQHPSRRLEIVWRLTAGLDQKVGVQNQLNDFTGRDLSDVLNNVDAVISTPSTAMLEAMLMDIPVAGLDYHHCPTYLPTAWTIRSAGEIENVIQELMVPPEPKMLFQRYQLADALANGNATDRLEILIETMLQIAAKQIENDQPLSFPERILGNNADPVKLKFDHARVYPSANEFGISDQVELQAELSHARREIELLQRELAQVQSELDLAHSIFDQIQQHPVAGPIVRLRQKFLDWFARNGERCEV